MISPTLLGNFPGYGSAHISPNGHHSDDWTKPSWPLTVLLDHYIIPWLEANPILSLCWGWFMIVSPWLSMMISPLSHHYPVLIYLVSHQKKSYCILLWHWVYHIILVVPGLTRPRWVGVGKTLPIYCRSIGNPGFSKPLDFVGFHKI